MAKTPAEANELRSSIEGLNKAMEANYEARMKSLEAAKAEAEAMGETMSRADAMRAQSEANIELAKQRLDALQQSKSSLDAEIDGLDRRIQAGEDLDGVLQNELDMKEQLRNMAKSQVEEEIKEALAMKRSNEQRKKRIELSEKLAGKIGDTVGVNNKWKESTLGLTYELYKSGGLISGTKQLTEALKDQFSLENIAMSFLQNLIDTTIALFKATDSATAAFRRATGAGFEYDNMIAETELDLRSYGVTVEEAGAQAGALFTNFAKFTKLSKAERKSLIQTNALLAKHGIGAQAAAEQTAILGETLGMTTEQITQTSRDLVALGKDLGIPPSVISTEFKQASGELAKYGRDMIGVFKQLAAESKATGLAVNDLLSITSGFETFGEASKRVSNLNQLLRGPYFNTLEMMQMSDAERSKLIRERVKQQGIDMDNMNKQQRLFVAQAMGINDVGKAMRFLRAESGVLDEMGSAAERATYDQEQLQEATQDLMSLQEKFSVLIKGFAIKLSPLLKPLHQVFNLLLDLQKEIVQNQKLLDPFINVAGEGLGKFVKILKQAVDMVKGADFGFGMKPNEAEAIGNSFNQAASSIGSIINAKSVFEFIKQAVTDIKDAFSRGGSGQKLITEGRLLFSSLTGGAGGKSPIAGLIEGALELAKAFRTGIELARALYNSFLAIKGVAKIVAGASSFDFKMMAEGAADAGSGGSGLGAVISRATEAEGVRSAAASRTAVTAAPTAAGSTMVPNQADLAKALKEAIVEANKENGEAANGGTRNIELKLDRFVLGRVLDDHLAEKVRVG